MYVKTIDLCMLILHLAAYVNYFIVLVIINCLKNEFIIDSLVEFSGMLPYYVQIEIK